MEYPLKGRDLERWNAVEAAYQRLIDADDRDVLQCWIYMTMDYGGWVIDEMCGLEDWLEELDEGVETPVKSDGFKATGAYFYSDFERIYSADHLNETPMDAEELTACAFGYTGQEFEIDEITALMEAD